MASLAVADVVQLSTPPEKKSPLGVGTYTVELPLSAWEIKEGEQMRAQEKVELVRDMALDGPFPEHSSSSSLNDHQSMIRESQVAPHALHSYETGLSEELVDGCSTKAASPPSLPHMFASRERPMSVLSASSQDTHHFNSTYHYSASEPGHGHRPSFSSAFFPPRTGKSVSTRRPYHHDENHIGHEVPSLRMSSINAGHRTPLFAGAELASDVDRRYSDAMMTYPSHFPSSVLSANEHGAPMPQHQAPIRPPRNKLRKPPPSGYRPPSENPSRNMSISLTSRPQSPFSKDTLIDLTHSPPATFNGRSPPPAFPGTSSETAQYFAQTSSPSLTRRPTSPQYASESTSASCASRSGSAEDSTFSASLYASTAPTSPSTTSDGAHKYLHYSHSQSSHITPTYSAYPSGHETNGSPCAAPDAYAYSSPIPSPEAPFLSYQSPANTPSISQPPQSSRSPHSPRKLTKRRPFSPPPLQSQSPSSGKFAGGSLPPPARSAKEARSIENGHAYAVDGFGGVDENVGRKRSILGLKIGFSHRDKNKGAKGKGKNVGSSHKADAEEQMYVTELGEMAMGLGIQNAGLRSSMWSVPEGEKMPDTYTSSPSLPTSPTCPQIPTSNTRRRSSTISSNSHIDRTSRALSDLAFTGTTSALSSSALAALTARLSTYEGSPEWVDVALEPIYQYDPYPYDSRLEVKSDDGHGQTSKASVDMGVGSGGRRRGMSEIGHGTKSPPSRSSSISFLNQDPYPSIYSRTQRSFPLPRARSHSYSRPHSHPSQVQHRDFAQNSRAHSQTHDVSESPTKEADPVASMRRWTLAMTDVSDEVLVQELERLRKESAAALNGRGRVKKKVSLSNTHVSSSESGGTGGHGEQGTVEGKVIVIEKKNRRGSGCDFVYGGPSVNGASPTRVRSGKFHVGVHQDDNLDHLSDGDESEEEEPLSDEEEDDFDDSSDDSDWKIARRALLCCRELVLTERTYQSHLRTLLSGDISPTSQHSRVPALVLSYLPALLNASQAFLARVEDDPSAWGVSAAWLGCEEELESAFVGWCGVVGELFVDREEGKDTGKKLLKSGPPSATSRRGSMSVLAAHERSKNGTPSLSMTALTLQTSRKHRPMSDMDFPPSSSRSTRDEPMSIPPVMTKSFSHGSGLFTAALGTGLPFGLSTSPPKRSTASSSPALAGPIAVRSGSDSGFSFSSSSSPRMMPLTTINTNININTNTKGQQQQGQNGSVSLTRSFTAALRRKSFLGSSVSLPSGLLSTEKREREKEKVREKKMLKKGKGREGEKKASVRELAIQPTQRIMRYVLQYRDLLQHTPVSSPSRALVERALESAVRIAQKCDRAQGNSAFLRR
ncbi:unnamed protein product [Somion occarium]|uniref:DH domain-containing protein n=1 Tax=Somion occarium TaxID=3059160 RepID=A0ABP1CIN8_9APHY